MKAQPKPWKSERHLYGFDCAGCGKPDRRTLRRSRARDGLCRECVRKGAPNENQLKLV